MIKKESYLGESGNVDDDVFGVGDGLDEDGFSLLVYSSSEVLGVGSSDPFYTDTKLFESH